MKIVFLSDDFPPTSFGGAGISTYELAKSIQKAGHEVLIITTCRKKEEAGESQYDGLKIFKIATNYDSRFRSYSSLNNRPVVRQVEVLLKKIKPDVVHANNIHLYLSYRSLKIAKQYAKTVIFTARDTMAFSYGKLETNEYLKNLNTRMGWFDGLKRVGKRWNPFRNFIIRYYLRYADKVIAISNALKDALNKNGIGNVEVIYNGIDTSQWQPDLVSGERFKEKYNLVDKKMLLFSGRLSAAKGGAKAIEALVSIVREVPSTVLLIAGSVDEYAQAMQAYAKELKIENNLVFTGWLNREEIKLAYGVSDVVLMPSIYLDAFGRVNIEAMAAQKPVIGTCYGGTPEIVIDGVTGYIVNPLHPEEIAAKTLDLLKNPQKAEALGKAGYERVLEHFSLERIAGQYVSWYNNLAL
ncbi:MAG: glycosyltransferase family 4 protein [Patescibacteria group bacterium]